MPKREIIWKYINTIEKLSSIYKSDFREDNQIIDKKLKILKSFINKKDFKKFNSEEIKMFCVNEWKKTIIKVISKLQFKIKNRKTRGSEFSDVFIQLKKLKDDIDIEDYSLEYYENIYEEDLKLYVEQIKEKIINEKYQKNNFVKGILIGALLGFLLGVLANIIYGLIF